MRYSRLLGKTTRAAPRDIKLESHALLLRGGFIRGLGRGLFSFLPLGWRVVRNIETIIREEMEALGGQEVNVPLVNPSEIWRSSGRSDLIDRELVRFSDRTGRDFVLAPTHEEAVVELARSTAGSYRDLPFFVYQFQHKFRDEEKLRGGLIGAREFLMSDGYSFHRNFADLNIFFPKVFAAYGRIFKRCGIEAISAQSAVGYMGGERAYEFLMPNPIGEELVVTCARCGYRSKREIAKGIKDCASPSPAPVERRETPDCATVAEIAASLGLRPSGIAKAMVYKLRSAFVMAVVRGDYEVSEAKLSRVLGEPIFRLATAEELGSRGLVPGYLSPLRQPAGLQVVVDDAVANSANLVFGGNEPGVHYANVNFGRDFEAETVADIVYIKTDDRCYECGGPLSEARAVELGNLFKLNDFYSRAMELDLPEEGGRRIHPYMGSYGIGIGRLLAAIVESNHDDRGIRWPPELSPYLAYLMGVGKSLSVPKALEEIHALAPEKILYDDRAESPGVKFQDADLVGSPLRIVVSAKNLEGRRVEFRDRRTDAVWLVELDRTAEALAAFAAGRAPDEV